eukprot:gene985-580_t
MFQTRPAENLRPLRPRITPHYPVLRLSDLFRSPLHHMAEFSWIQASGWDDMGKETGLPHFLHSHPPLQGSFIFFLLFCLFVCQIFTFLAHSLLALVVVGIILFI